MTIASFDELCEQWLTAAQSRPVDVAGRDGAIRAARLRYRDRATRDDGWITAALNDPRRWAFALETIRGALPRRMLRTVVKAAIDHPNVSSNQYFVNVAVDAFGREATDALLQEYFDAAPDKWERDKVRAAIYWVPYAETKRRDKLTRKRAK